MKTFEEAIALRPSDMGCFIIDAFQLKEEFVRVFIWSAAEFSAIVGEDSLDGEAMLLKEGEDVIVEEMH